MSTGQLGGEGKAVDVQYGAFLDKANWPKRGKREYVDGRSVIIDLDIF